MQSLLFAYLITVTVVMLSADLGAERGTAVHSSPPLMTLTAGSSYVTAPMTTAVPRANWKCVRGIEAQQIVVGVTEEMQQHLVKNTTENEQIMMTVGK